MSFEWTLGGASNAKHMTARLHGSENPILCLSSCCDIALGRRHPIDSQLSTIYALKVFATYAARYLSDLLCVVALIRLIEGKRLPFCLLQITFPSYDSSALIYGLDAAVFIHDRPKRIANAQHPPPPPFSHPSKDMWSSTLVHKGVSVEQKC
jgi:hypothetical protein